MNALKVEYVKTSDLRAYPKNARLHGADQVAQVVESIRQFGWTNPILIDEKNSIIAGHCRLDAAAKLDMATVPCIRLAGLTDSQKRALVLADNKLALNASWDWDVLATELQELKADEFDISLTGFADLEIANLLGETIEAMATNASLRESEPDDRDMWPVLRIAMPAGVKARIDEAMSSLDGEDWQRLESLIFGDVQH